MNGNGGTSAVIFHRLSDIYSSFLVSLAAGQHGPLYAWCTPSSDQVGDVGCTRNLYLVDISARQDPVPEHLKNK